MSCASSSTVMAWSKFVYVYWRVDGAGGAWCGGAGFADRKNAWAQVATLVDTVVIEHCTQALSITADVRTTASLAPRLKTRCSSP